MPALCAIGGVAEDNVQPATLMLIKGHYPDFNQLPGLQSRRDLNIGSFLLKNYQRNIPHFEKSLIKTLSSESETITALFLDENNDIAFVKPLGAGNKIDCATLVADCTLFTTEMPKRTMKFS